MDSFALSAGVVALWRVFLRLAKASIIRAALAGWLAPETASGLLRRFDLGEA